MAKTIVWRWTIRFMKFEKIVLAKIKRKLGNVRIIYFITFETEHFEIVINAFKFRQKDAPVLKVTLISKRHSS